MQRRDPVERRVAHRDRRFEREPSAEDSEPGEELLLVRAEQVVAPGDRVAERPVPVGKVAGPTAEELEPLVEEREHRLGRQQLRPGGRQLQGERQVVEARADVLDGFAVRLRQREARVGSLRAIDEERDRVVQVERVDRVLPLAGDPERGSASHEERQPGRRLEHLRDDRRRFDDLLEVVEHDERPAPGEALREALTQRTLSALAHAQRLGDRRHQEGVIADRVERDEERAVREILGKGVRSLDGQARLSGAARAGERDHTRVSPERRRHLVELAAAPDHRAHGNGHVAGGERAARQALVLAEDRLLQLPQLGAGLQAELVEERLARGAVRLQRVRLAPRAVEREHQQSAEPFPERVLDDQRLELTEHLVVAAEPELGLDPVLGRREPQLVEPRDLALDERVVAEIRERLPTPERQRLLQELGGLAVRAPAERCRSFHGEPLEALGVQLVGLDPQAVGAALGRQAVGDDLPHLRDVDLERVRRGRGRLLAPQVLDQEIGSDELVSVQQKQREQCTRLTAFYRERRAIRFDLERPKNAVLHRILLLPPTDRNAQVSGFFQGLVGAS